MAETFIPTQITLARETARHLRHGEWAEAQDVLRHEGVKRLAEGALSLARVSDLSRWIIEEAAGPVLDPRLRTEFAGLQMATPVGVGAGWDKSGKSSIGLQTMGASHLWPGGITYYPQAGLPMPRLRSFDNQVGDHGRSRSLNAFGFYSPGVTAVAANLQKQRDSGLLKVPLIPQVTVNKEFYLPENRHMIPSMLAATIRRLAPVADGISLGLTSPNTLGMRDAQQYSFLRACVEAANEAADGLPVELKGDGDGGEARLDMYCQLVVDGLLKAISLINTTTLPNIKARYGVAELPGGLAGADPDYKALAVKSVGYVFEQVGDKVTINGLGGNNSHASNLALLEAGASVTSLVTSINQNRAHAFTKLQWGLVEHFDAHPEIKTMDDVIGSKTARGSKASQRA